MEEKDHTRILRDSREEASIEATRRSLAVIYEALRERGYDPVRQIAHFLLTGEPTYITGYKNARSLAQKLERDVLLEDIVRCYLNRHIVHSQEVNE